MSDERRPGDDPPAREGDENRALTEWTSEEELEREDERLGGEDAPKLTNPPG